MHCWLVGGALRHSMLHHSVEVCHMLGYARVVAVVLGAFACWLTAQSAAANAYHLVYPLPGGATASIPRSGLAAVDGALYGTTFFGGAFDSGLTFSVQPDGSNFQPTHYFFGGEGKFPRAALSAVGTRLYGSTTVGGADNSGTLFSINADGSDFQTLHSFNFAHGGTIDRVTAVGGAIFGTTNYGGSSDVLFRMNADGSDYQELHTYAKGPDNGINPTGPLATFGSHLYGTVSSGVYSVGLDGQDFQLIHAVPGTKGGVTLVGDTLYGTTDVGGAFAHGFLYSLNVDGSGYHVLHDFNQGFYFTSIGPSGGLVQIGARLYGVSNSGGASGNGFAYTIMLDGSGYQVLHDFAGTHDARQPDPYLTVIGNTVYGVAPFGPEIDPYGGTIFALEVPEPGSAVLLGAGIAAIWAVGRWKSVRRSHP
jgi:uncharacterized repeat protein (TIGR03803 family)